MYKEKTVNNSSSGIGFFGLLAIVFITLKLTGFITWPWILILSPLWIGFLLVVFFVIAVALIQLMYG